MTTPTRPLLLDLFCGAGGGAAGYHRAGFHVVGVDNRPQSHYPFQFHQGDALTYLADHGDQFDAVHASPPCQAFTTMSNRHRGAGGRADSHTDLIAAVRDRIPAGMPYIIENVPGARRQLRDPFLLRGGMFGLGVDRPRLFETNFPVMLLSPTAVAEPVGIYGALDGRRLWNRADGTVHRAARTLEQGRAAMGIDWMDWRGLTQSIPPAYTEHIGRLLLAQMVGAA